MLFPEAECTEMRMIRNSIWYVILLTSHNNLMRECAVIITEQDMPGTVSKRRAIGTFGLLALLSASLPGHAEEENQHPHKKYAIAAFLGGTRVDSSNEFTVGVEAGYNINSTWSIGAVVERADREQHSTLFLLGLGWHPIGPALRLQLGAGRKDPSGHTETVVRTGVAYEFEMEHDWFIKPYIALDFISHEDNEQVFGIYIGKGF